MEETIKNTSPITPPASSNGNDGSEKPKSSKKIAVIAIVVVLAFIVGVLISLHQNPSQPPASNEQPTEDYTPVDATVAEGYEDNSYDTEQNSYDTEQNNNAEEGEVLSEVSRKYTVIGKDDENVYYLKGKKGQYEPYIYYQPLSSGGELSVNLTDYYDGSMQISDYAYNNGKITVIIYETDRNSTGFLVATLVVTYNPKQHSSKELTGGGCVEAKFNSTKTKVTLTFGDIVNPDAMATYEYKYSYSTKVISL